MARARAQLPARDAILGLIDESGRLAVRVTPGARVEALDIEGGRLIAKVRAKPEDGKANAAVRGLLAEALGLAPGRLTLLRGATSREKQFAVER